MFSLVLLASSCGYVGDPLPPALNIPMTVEDLRARQIGPNLAVNFTLPARTTENLPIKNLSEIDLRMGPVPPGGWHQAGWEETAVKIPVPATDTGPIEASAPVAGFAGKEIAVLVRLANRKGRYSPWSNVVTLRIESAVSPPTGLKADSAPEGAIVTWEGEPRARIYRDGKLAGEGNQGRFVDADAELGKTYTYSAEAIRNGALSEIAGAATVTVEDRFPPAAPRAVSAIVGTNSIEITWERNTEADLKGYIVMRAEGDGKLETVGPLVDISAYSDRTVRSGQRYRYVIAAIDIRNNRSAASQPVEITFP